MRTPLGNERSVEALSRLVQARLGKPDPVRLEEGLRRVNARVRARESRRSRGPWWVALAVANVAAALVLWQSNKRLPAADPRPPAVSFSLQVQGGNVLDGGYLRETDAKGITLSFTDGSKVIFRPGTRGRLRDVDGAAVRLAVEHGTADVAIVAAAARTWKIDAGPYLLTVKGAAFTVSWDIAAERFELVLQRGRVDVSGPATGDLSLEGGHRLVVDLPRGDTRLTEWPDAEVTVAGGTSLREPPPAHRRRASAPHAKAVALVAAEHARPTGPAVAPPAERPRPASSTPTPSAGAEAGTTSGVLDVSFSWTEALAQGRLDEILGDAARMGRRASLDGTSAEDLMALADAARYRRKIALARDALLAARRRFSGSPRATDAAYLLGRVEELEPAAGRPAALRWYDIYLAASPRGTYAGEALGRKMILTSESHDGQGARALAALYLRRFPSGTYRGAAEALSRAP